MNSDVREISIFCIMNLLKGNLTNQKLISGLEAQRMCPSDVLQELGLNARLDEDGKVKVISQNAKGSDNK